MLLNAFKSIYKQAYVKGIASAVVLTAGLAAGQANAGNTLTGTDGILQDTEVTADYKDADITVSGVANDDLQEGPYALSSRTNV